MNIIIFGAAGIIIGQFLGRAIWELYSFIKKSEGAITMTENEMLKIAIHCLGVQAILWNKKQKEEENGLI